MNEGRNTKKNHSKVIIYEGCMFLVVQRSHSDGYNLFKSIKLDDPPIKKIGEVVINSIILSTEFLRHACVEL